MSEQPDRPETTPMPPERGGEALQLGIVPLRPLALPDLVSGTAQALRRNTAALVGLGFATVALTELLGWFFATLVLGDVPTTVATGATVDWDAVRPIVVDTLMRTVVAAVLGLLLSGAVNVVVPRAVFGHTTSPGEALSGAWVAMPRLLGVFLLQLVVFGGIGAVALLAVVFGGAGGALLALSAAAGLVYLAIAFTFAHSAVVVEGARPAEALKRSRELVHAAGWWRVFGVLLLAGVVFGIVGMIVGALFGAVGGAGAFTAALAGVLVGMFATPVTLVLQVLLYVDHRSRTEGIDGLWRTAG